MPIDGYYALTYDSNGGMLVALDPSQSGGEDLAVVTSIYTQAQGIRDYVLAVIYQQYLDIANLEVLYNNANRIVSNYLAGTLLTYLQALAPIFNTWLARIVMGRGLQQLFGAALDALVTQLDTWYNGPNNELRRLSTRTIHSWPMIYGPEDQYGGTAFPLDTGVAYNPTNMCLEITDTNGFYYVDTQDLVGNIPLEQGPTIEFMCRRLQQHGMINQFLSIGLASYPGEADTGSTPAVLGSISWLSKGLRLDVGQPIECTDNAFDVSVWMHVIILRSGAKWYMQVAQNGIKTTLNTSTSEITTYGVLNLNFFAGSIGSSWQLKDVVASTGLEYDVNNMDMTIQDFWNHGADTVPGEAHTFSNVVTLYSNLLEGTATGPGDVFIDSGANITPAGDWTMFIDLWFTDWETSDQSLFMYETARGGSKFMNLYYPTSGNDAKIFWLHSGVGNVEILFPKSIIQDQTWHTLKIAFEAAGRYTIWVDAIQRGFIDTSIAFSSINDILFAIPSNGSPIKYRRLLIYDGLV